MTEAEWLTGTDLAAQVQFASERLSPRRLRLLAVGFCRVASHLFSDPYLEEALHNVEHYADDLITADALDRVRRRCREIAQQSYELYRLAEDQGAPDGLAAYVRGELAWSFAFAANNPFPVDTVVGIGGRVALAISQHNTGAVLLAPIGSSTSNQAIVEQMRVMRSVVWEVTGNPFRAVHFSPDWRTHTAMAIANQMYESREFSAMPILADALQDAGCDNEELLAHCRDHLGAGASRLGSAEPTPHVRGCWAVDLVLGKS